MGDEKIGKFEIFFFSFGGMKILKVLKLVLDTLFQGRLLSVSVHENDSRRSFSSSQLLLEHNRQYVLNFFHRQLSQWLNCRTVYS